MLSNLAARRRGFTLIELMIVIIVIAILALIVIPRLAGASMRAKESTMQSNMQTIRNAVANFNADCGTYPTSLSDLLVTSAPSYVVSSAWKGPYLNSTGYPICATGSALPQNPVVYSSSLTGETATAPSSSTTPAANWYYQSASGVVLPGVLGTTHDGSSTPYSLL